MDRNEVKKQMRAEMVRDLSEEQRDITTTTGLTPNQMMDEVDRDTEIGKALLESFLHPEQELRLPPLTPEQRAEILALMQKDLDAAAAQVPEWANTEKIAQDDDGNELTPNQVFQQVKDGTTFGDQYARAWLARHNINAKLTELQGDPEKMIHLLTELLNGGPSQNVHDDDRQSN